MSYTLFLGRKHTKAFKRSTLERSKQLHTIFNGSKHTKAFKRSGVWASSGLQLFRRLNAQTLVILSLYSYI